MIDTRVGTDAAVTKTAGLFGKGSEEHGQTLPSVGVPHGMNLRVPQTRDTEQKCIAPYYFSGHETSGFPQQSLDCGRLHAGLRLHDSSCHVRETAYFTQGVPHAWIMSRRLHVPIIIRSLSPTSVLKRKWQDSHVPESSVLPMAMTDRTHRCQSEFRRRRGEHRARS